MNAHCPISNVNIPRFLAIILAGFIFVFGFEFVWHGMLLMDHYEATMHLWRPKAEMQAYFPYVLATQLAFVAALAFVFTRNYEGKGLSEGLRFGLALGVLLGIGQFGMYAYMTIPLALAALWFVGAVFEVAGLGLLFALIYRK